MSFADHYRPLRSHPTALQYGFLARVFNQDTFNLGQVQRGLHAARHSHVTFARYQETKIRHFHALLARWVHP